MATIKMVRGVVGEDRTDWLPGEIKTCSDWYAEYLVGRRAAVLVTAVAAKEADGLDTAKAAPVNRMARAPRTR